MMKTILITGVSRGLGLGIARKLLADGYRLIGVSRTETDDIVELQKRYPDDFEFISFDLSATAEIDRVLFKKRLSADVCLSGLVNNAAHAYDDLVTNIDRARLEAVIDVNIVSPILLTKGVIRNMLLHNTTGSLVHISSISTKTGYKGLAMYAATKGALEAFSKNVAREWGRRCIRSNCVVPGFMETDMSRTLSDDQRSQIYRRTALGTPTQIESVAATVGFLLADESGSITGQNIYVDSGTV